MRHLSDVSNRLEVLSSCSKKPAPAAKLTTIPINTNAMSSFNHMMKPSYFPARLYGWCVFWSVVVVIALQGERKTWHGAK